MPTHHIYRDLESGMRIEIVVPWGDSFDRDFKHGYPPTVELTHDDGQPWVFVHEQSV